MNDHGPLPPPIGAATRIDRDPIGAVVLPADSLHGAQGERARLNFSLSDTMLSDMPMVIVALAQVKQAAALVNGALGAIDSGIADAIVDACAAIVAGGHHDAFVIDACQGGAGTSTNMIANEVIANLALDRLGMARGRYDIVHPNDHVNRGQSTNDVYATAIRIALFRLNRELVAALRRLSAAFAEKATAFADIPKLGRTQLQDAVPMTLGQEFAAFSTTVGEDAARAEEIAAWFLEVNIGGTAIGTGLGADPEYRTRIAPMLCRVTGLNLVVADDPIEATWDTGAFVLYSGMLKRIAAKLSKISNDLRLLSSGPAGGIGEIHLPMRQPGSSIMPGKVNPVIPEAFNCIAFRVFGLDTTITFAAEAGQLQLNAFEPVILWSLHDATTLLTRGIDMLIDHCIDGIVADSDRCARNLRDSTALATILVPIIGYARAAEVAKYARKTGDLVAAVAALEPSMLAYIAVSQTPGFALRPVERPIDRR